MGLSAGTLVPARGLAAFGGSFRVYLFFYLKFTIRSAFCQPALAVLLG